ncbi:MAG: MinD/ParA family protein [Planctomycetes bacterium]|nr:MinD/ParA family protein [Planctomycetota bacterium]
MIRDQASELRNLARRAHHGSPVVAIGAPLVGVAGCRRGVGATSVAVGLAAGLAESGLRIVLADADPICPAVAARCGLARCDASRLDLRDAVEFDRDFRGMLVTGPQGLQILPTRVDRSTARMVPSEAACDRFADRFRALGRHADGLLVDLGSSAAPLATRLWRAADHLIVVLRADDQSLMDAYARLKTNGLAERTTLHILVNGAADEPRATDLVARLAHASERFLGIAVLFTGWLPESPAQPGSPSNALDRPGPPTETGRREREDAAMEPIVTRWRALLEPGRVERPACAPFEPAVSQQRGGTPERT